MKIDYIKTIGFRKFQKLFETNLYDTTLITGKNRSGKSNILYAIINILLGSNLSGDEKVCLINQKSDASYGELHFEDNQGIKHILIRGKSRIGTKNTFLSLDGKPITQNQLISFYKDKKLLLSILNPFYFLNKRPAEQKELVDKYLSDIRASEIFNKLDNKEQGILINRYYKNKSLSFYKLSKKEQNDFINTHIFNIMMDIAYDNLEKEEQEKLEGIPKDITSYISELNQDIKDAEKKITTLNGKIEYAEKIANEPISENKKFYEEVELSLAYQELDTLTNDTKIKDKENQKKKVEELEKEILNETNEIMELEKSMNEGKKKYLAIKEGSISTCPTCEQHIQDISKSKTIENMRNELTNQFNRKNTLEARKKDLELKLSIEKCQYYALKGNTSIDNSKKILNIQEKIKILESKQKEIERFNNEIHIKQKNIQNAKSDISNFNKQISIQNRYISDLKDAKKIAQKLYITYIEEKMKLAKKYLKDVDVKFYSVLKTTGEIKEDFIITYKNIPLSNLSKSEATATALEFANMFNQISRVKLPIFIDDAESYADYDFIKEYSKNSQLIIAQVEKGKALKIADYNNSDNFTIIKPVINGFRTMHIKNDADIQKAA